MEAKADPLLRNSLGRSPLFLAGATDSKPPFSFNQHKVVCSNQNQLIIIDRPQLPMGA
jgi:hypothetical protein